MGLGAGGWRSIRYAHPRARVYDDLHRDSGRLGIAHFETRWKRCGCSDL